MYLDQINNPDDLKKLSLSECETLAVEIRTLLVKKASKKGGHLSSNLGIVETTIAIHYVFSSPTDQIVFDVSHQCYTHKILTGRKDAFIDEDKYQFVNGYTNPEESVHDNFRVGHTATSISLAAGLAKARDLSNADYSVVALIGDGSLSGGQALEGLDYVGSEIKGNLVIIFNDNQMSIAENHGGMYKNLQELRDSKGTCTNNLFKAFGLDYLYVEDGNNVEQVVSALKIAKSKNHPIVLHICTEKGHGVKFAVENKESTHWVRPFDITTGAELHPFQGERYDRIIRDHLIKKMKEDSKVVTMIAAVPDALNFTEEHRLAVGEQFIDVGIAEEHAIAMSAGLAKNGYKPVFATMSTFFQRTYDQISQELCINKMAATLVVVNASVYAANDVTHIGIFDIPMLSNIPNLVYLAPTNRQEYIDMLDWSIGQKEWPVAIRAPRNGIFDYENYESFDYSQLNTYKTVVDGEKVAIIALGDFFQLGEKIQRLLMEKYGFNATLINPRYITGLDIEKLATLKEKHSVVVTLEDGVLDGGFGQKIASYYGKDSIRVYNYGLRKEFLDRYDVNEVIQKNRLDENLILEDIKDIIELENMRD